MTTIETTGEPVPTETSLEAPELEQPSELELKAEEQAERHAAELDAAELERRAHAEHAAAELEHAPTEPPPDEHAPLVKRTAEELARFVLGRAQNGHIAHALARTRAAVAELKLAATPSILRATVMVTMPASWRDEHTEALLRKLTPQDLEEELALRVSYVAFGMALASSSSSSRKGRR
jgi:hypothetical protein